MMKYRNIAITNEYTVENTDSDTDHGSMNDWIGSDDIGLYYILLNIFNLTSLLQSTESIAWPSGPIIIS